MPKVWVGRAVDGSDVWASINETGDNAAVCVHDAGLPGSASEQTNALLTSVLTELQTLNAAIANVIDVRII